MGQRSRAIGGAREPNRLGQCGREPIIGENTSIDKSEGCHTIVTQEHAGEFGEPPARGPSSAVNESTGGA